MYYVYVQNRQYRMRSGALLSQCAYTERPIPPLVEEKTPLPSSDQRDTKIQVATISFPEWLQRVAMVLS
jgi:hypothetical protein